MIEYHPLLGVRRIRLDLYGGTHTYDKDSERDAIIPRTGGGFRGGVTRYSREKDSRNDCPFSVNPPGLQYSPVMRK